MSRPVTLAIAACFVCASLLAHAQGADNALHAPDGGTSEMIASIFIPPVSNAPFQATVTLEWTKHLADGSTTIVRNHRLVVRDSQGDIYQERRTLVPDGSIQEPRIRWIEISFPAKHTQYMCNATLTTCQLRAYHAQPMARVAAPGANANSKPGPGRVAPVGRSSPTADPNLTRTDLGSRSIEGLDAVGTRETRTIPPGTLGNSAPLEISKEFWYSPRLRVNLRVLRVDPLHGDQSFEMTDIDASEPDPQRFVLPPNCKIVDLRARKNSQTDPSDPSE